MTEAPADTLPLRATTGYLPAWDRDARVDYWASQWRPCGGRLVCFATAVDWATVVIGLASIAASAAVAITSLQTQRRLAADAVRTDRENELRSVLDSAALALQVAYKRLITAVESVDREPSYDYDNADDPDLLQAEHESLMVSEGRYWMRGAVDEFEHALQDLEILQARLGVRLGSSDRLHGIVHNARNVLAQYGLRPLRELAANASWTDRPFGESLREMIDQSSKVGRKAQWDFIEAASARVGLKPATTRSK